MHNHHIEGHLELFTEDVFINTMNKKEYRLILLTSYTHTHKVVISQHYKKMTPVYSRNAFISVLRGPFISGPLICNFVARLLFCFFKKNASPGQLTILYTNELKSAQKQTEIEM